MQLPSTFPCGAEKLQASPSERSTHASMASGGGPCGLPCPPLTERRMRQQLVETQVLGHGEHIKLDNFRWQTHCQKLYQLPVAA